MKRQPRILAGTAIGLLMASAPLGAYPLQGSAAFGTSQGAPLILAESKCAQGQSGDACVQGGQQDSGQQGEAEQPRKKKREQQQQTQSAPAAEQAPANQGAAPATEEQQPRKKKREQQIEAAPAGEAAPANDDQQQGGQGRKKHKQQQQQQIEAAPADQGAAPATDEQQPRKKKRNQQQIEAAPADQQQPAEQVAPAGGDQQQGNQGRKKRKHDQQQQTEGAPAGEATPTEQTAPANDNGQGANQGKKKHRQNQQGEQQPAGQTPVTEPAQKTAPAGEPVPQAKPLQNGEQPAQGEQPQDKKKHGKKPTTAEQPANGEQPATGQQPKTGQQPATGEQQPATGEQPANSNQPAKGGNAAQGETANPNEAPMLDSQKDAERKGGGRKHGDKNGQQNGGDQNGGQNAQQGGDQGKKPVVAPVDQGPPPTDDKAAQQQIKPEKFVPVTEEKGKRLDRAPDENIRDRRRPKGVDVLKEIGDRVIIQLGGQTIVQSNEGSRMNRGAKDVYYEDLPQGRTRETVERGNGVQIVTIRNRYGDVIRRSRITPDGREYVLSYVDEQDYQDEGDWRDPGDDLPPMRLTIPRRDYILDSEDVQSADDYYTFLDQPPVERVQRLYSIDEVKRSARVRDIARRVDLDTLNFEFGSASISDTEVQKLEGVADAMEKLLKKNPAETFLIEGHTDAVGAPEANLALSDRRAESVAEALTNAFGIPPENLTTQGYGEEYLKVNTQSPNRENRRVAIRRITSLVAPVASNN